jgi:hypothetical protein
MEKNNMGIQRYNLRKKSKSWYKLMQRVTQEIKDYESPMAGVPWTPQEIKSVPFSFHRVQNMVPLTGDDTMNAWKKKYRWSEKKKQWILK